MSLKPSLGWQWRFVRGFLTGNAAQAPPFALVVDVTERCNLNCLHCRRHSPQAAGSSERPSGADFPLDCFLDLCREAKAWGVRKMVLIGEGEPLLHPGLADMVAAAKAASCRVVMLTNGILLNMRLAEEFIKAGLDELRVSLWASNEKEYRLLNPGARPEMFHRTLEGVRLVVAARRKRGSPLPWIVVHRPIDPRFFRRIEGTLDLARQLGGDAVSFSPMKPLLPQDLDRLLTADEERELVGLLPHISRKAQAAGLADNTAELRRRLKIGRAVWEKQPCYIGWIDMRLRVNGDVVPCDTCNWVMGNIHRHGIREIWNSPAYHDFRRISRRPLGIVQSGRNCLCDFCCHAITNARVDRFLKWCAPAAAASKEANV
jgi:radical SAM protein with 4Fe4S-binding SPASM domain